MTVASRSHPGSPVLAAVEAALFAPSGTCGPGALTGSCAHCPVPFSTLATLLVCELGACMTSQQQRAALQRQIWQIANEVRGAVDGWDFKQYVLGTLFYRFISEDFTSYIQADDDSVQYAELSDDVVTDEIKNDAIKTKGYFIYPSQLFANVAESAPSNDDLNTDLASIFSDIEASANGFPSEGDIKGLFADFDTTSDRLGDTVREKNMRLTSVLRGVEGLAFDGFEESRIDLFGDAYEFLISNYAANAGKSGGEFFTPQQVSKLIAQLVPYDTIVENDYNLSVNSYVEPVDTRETVDIEALNAEIEGIVARQSKLRAEIDGIVADLEGDSA